MIRRVARHCAACALLVASAAASAAEGDLDMRFGRGGVVFLGDAGEPLAVSRPVVDRDGRILVCRSGYSSYDPAVVAGAVYRLDADGSIDTRFAGGDGAAFPTSEGNRACGLALQHDGRIVVFSGRVADDGAAVPGLETELVRFEPDGTRDFEFGDAGIAHVDFVAGETDDATAIAIAPDDSIVVGVPLHPNRFGVARFDRDGALDASFGDAGRAMARFPVATLSSQSIASVLVDGHGRTVVVGSIMTEPVGRELFAFARFARDGSPDATFGDGGQTTIDFGDVSAAPGAGLLQGDRIVAVGSAKTVWPPNEGSGNADVAVARLRDDGTLDRAFGDDGLAIVAIDRTPDAYDLAYDAIGTVDGGLAIVGATESDGGDGRGFLMRLDANGAPLPGFADGGARIFDDVINGENAATTFTGIAAAGSGYIVTGHSGATPTPVTQGLVARVEGAALGRHSRHRIKMPRVPVRIGAAPRGAAPRAGAGG